MNLTLAILIPTVSGREDNFQSLLEELHKQEEFIKNSYPDIYDEKKVKVISVKDNKEMSIGLKRQKLLQMAEACDFVVFIDDDDMISPKYLLSILESMNSHVDCIGFKIRCTFDNGPAKTAVGSNVFKEWGNNQFGYDYVRTIYHKNPIKRDIAAQIGFNDLRYAEDHDYSIRLKQSELIRNEVFIDDYLYYYQYSSKIPHNDKYGIK